jgi:hypothetical protein
MTRSSRTALKLACFAGLSLLIHVMILLGINLPDRWQSSFPPPLAARLQPSAPAAVVAAPRPQHPAKRGTPPIASPAAVTESAQPSLAEAVADATAPLRAAPQAEDPAEIGAMPETPVVARQATVPDIPTQAPSTSVTQLPQKGQIDYVLYYGANKVWVGRTRQTWEILDGRYHLSSISETTGIVALFASQRIAYESRGRLTEAGLQPESFSTRRTRSGRTESAGADFDWQAMKVSFGNPRQSTPLPSNTQDLLSFMYQVGLMEPLQGRIQLPITNGWKLERYDLDIGGEHILETPIGAILAIPLIQTRRPGQESVELWLAPAYRLLPVRIRFFDREGMPSGEQLVTDIRMSIN